jgi:hypothetical protein
MRTICKTSPFLLLVLSVWATPPRCQAQIHLLTVPESEEIIESLPLFKSSEKRGGCPGFDFSVAGTPGKLALQVRGFCPPEGFAGSMLIDNFEVDRSTGAVTLWGSGQPIAEPTVTTDLARALVERARGRVLSQREAECVAREAAGGESGPATPPTVVRIGRNTGYEMWFSTQYPLTKPRATAAGLISVDTSSLAVLEGGNGQRIHSPRVDELLSRMRAVRESPSLSVAETIEVAARVPSIAARISSECSPQLSADFGTAHGRFVEVQNTCEPYPRISHVVGAVDFLTGAVTDPRTHKALDTPESVELAQTLLERAKGRQIAAKAEVERACQTGNR